MRTTIAVLTLSILSSSLLAETPRVLPEGKLPSDRRLEPLKDLNGYFPFNPAESEAAWAKRSERVRRQLLVANGLWPMPRKTPLNAKVHGLIDMGDYTVEKAYFESMPGFYVTGNLYRPKGKRGKLPGVLSPHGHWANGRFYDNPADRVQKEIESGAEQFEENGRSPLQSRAAQLARLGCVVFHYDMIGYADNTQISFEIAHRFAKQRPEMNTTENWGLFSPQAEAHFQSVMGLQTYNSIRALDFLSELPDVDTSRLAVTGASGGGTQTFMISAVDPRVAVSFPAVMVSTAMQGGCTCENASNLRIDTGNVEFAALFAPKPIAMSAADDWTKEMKTKGFPELLQQYTSLGAKDNAMLLSRTEFAHNYNSVTRHGMYHWFNKHLKLGVKEPIEEKEIRRLSRAEMTVWNDEHPKPEGGDDFERKLLRYWHVTAKKQLSELKPTDAASLGKYREIIGGAIDIVIGRGLPSAKDLEYDQTYEEDRGDFIHMMGMLRNSSASEELPIAFLYPKQWEGRVVVWLDKDGKAGLFSGGVAPKPEIQQLLNAGVTVVGADLLYQGEFLADGAAIEKTRRVGNPREAAAYTFGYNHTVFAKRVHDVLAVLSFVESHETEPKRIDLVGLAGAGHWAAAASAQARDLITAAAIDTQGFRFGKVLDIHSPNFLPGGAKYGDLPGMLAIGAPKNLWLAGEGDNLPRPVDSAYKAQASGTSALVDRSGKPSDAVGWLLAQ
ncbi:MAG: acetylxylan esterase [Planctomycetaceae bacterium]|nr:acetylxylan esterase [Planctomycetaceae bacterium]